MQSIGLEDAFLKKKKNLISYYKYLTLRDEEFQSLSMS